MAELKTVPTRASVHKFLQGITDEGQRLDCYRLLELMKKATGAEPRMWGTSIVGFGKCHSVSEGGCEGEWFIAGFSPRKANITLYLPNGFEQHKELVQKLGKLSRGKGCLYIRRLEDVDLNVLRKLITQSTKLAAHRNGRHLR